MWNSRAMIWIGRKSKLSIGRQRKPLIVFRSGPNKPRHIARQLNNKYFIQSGNTRSYHCENFGICISRTGLMREGGGGRGGRECAEPSDPRLDPPLWIVEADLVGFERTEENVIDSFLNNFKKNPL